MTSNYVPPAGAVPDPDIAYLTTGIISGLEVQALTGDTDFTITAGDYFIEDISNPAAITRTRISVGPADFVNVPVANIATDDFTYLFLEDAGGGTPGLIQRVTPPTVDDLSNGLVYLGNLSHDDGTGLLTFDATNLGWSAYSATLDGNRQAFLHGTIVESGVRLDFQGNGFTPDVTAGVVQRLGAARLVDPTSPNRVPVPLHAYGVGPGPTLRAFANGLGGVTVQPEAVIVPNNFDDGSGTLAVGNATRYYRHIFYMFPVVGGAQVVFHQFGEQEYQQLDDAVNDAVTIPFPFLQEAAVVGVLSVQGNSVDPYADIIAGLADLREPATVSSLYR